MKKAMLFMITSMLLNQLVSASPAEQKKRMFGHVVEFNQTRQGSFDQTVGDAPIAVVYFYSPSCGPCKQLSPRILQLAKECPYIKFVKVNVSTNSFLAQKYGIRSVPQLLFFKNGAFQKGHTLTGLSRKDTIKRTIDRLS